jgi:uncharacterized protein YgiM (DUF1202 family)
MKKSPVARLWPAALLLAVGIPLGAAISTGGTAYTKKFETNLLAEPSPLAAVTGTVAFGRAVKVNEARGAWFKVADGAKAGWVFSGNLAETKPDQGKGLTGQGLAASQTSATAAARPLTSTGEAYATRRNLGEAREDLNWLISRSHSVKPADVEAFMKEQKKGEYQ